MAAKSPSLRLASLAASVRTPNTGNFGKVIDAVEDMNAVLKQEEQVEIDQHAWCQENIIMREAAKSRSKHKIEKTEAKIEKLNKTKEELEDAIVATAAEILATQEEVQAMEDALVAENDEFLKAKERPRTTRPLPCSYAWRSNISPPSTRTTTSTRARSRVPLISCR